MELHHPVTARFSGFVQLRVCCALAENVNCSLGTGQLIANCKPNPLLCNYAIYAHHLRVEWV